jgi:hypothetical protein
MRAPRPGAVLFTALVLAWVGVARGAGPLVVNGAGSPLVWNANPVPFNPDRGTLGSLNNSSAVAAVRANFNVWGAVPTTTLGFAHAGLLPVDVTAANWPSYLGRCDRRSEIVFDTDGTIVDDLFGVGASNDILGFAGPGCGSLVPPVITEGTALLNGKWIDGISSGTNPEISLEEFNGVFVHEFGHYVNLDHSQINLAEAFDGDPGNNDAVATMFPFAVKGAGAATLHLDDQVSISTLYPTPAFATGFGRLAGTVLRADGVTPFQGAYVIARRIGNPRLEAVGVASGARYFPAAPGGPPPASLLGFYEIPGLPPGEYTLEIEEISPLFNGSSSVGPLDPPARLPGVPEFYNGSNEAATNPPDDPSEWVPVASLAGVDQEGLDFIINGLPVPPHDDCSTPRAIPAIPYTDVVDTVAATTAAGDPPQSCTFNGPSQNSSSVWYIVTTTQGTFVTLDTVGSNYDTILTAYTGGCGAPKEIACNDDWGSRLASRITVPVTPRSPVLLEVTSFGATGGGTLVLNARAPLRCGPMPAAGCRTTSGQSEIRLADNTDPARDQVAWKWRSGSGTALDDLGDPTQSTDYAFCLYDAVVGIPTLKLGAFAPAGGTCRGKPCWRRRGLRVNYANPEQTPDGLRQVLVQLKPFRSGRVSVKGRGLNLGLPSIPLAQQDRVIVQLMNSDGACWGAEFTSPAMRASHTRFMDRCDSGACY